EHEFGVDITTFDNPGWGITIDLSHTWLEKKPFEPLHREESKESWISCKVEEFQFRGISDPSRLNELIEIFVAWAKTVPDWLSALPDEPDSLYETQIDQSDWSSINSESQEDPCQAEGCNSRRIRYSVFCRKHHFRQLKHRDPIPACEIWAYGSESGVNELRSKILNSVRSAYGPLAIVSNTAENTTFLELDWLKKPVQLLLVDFPDENLFKIRFANESDTAFRDCREHFLRQFFHDVVEASADTTGGAVVTLNIWHPDDN
ncbi:MAG: immunity 53 family protein, partial [Cyanobacteria bacterium]|nr:immunity 53 family protein [Cyanobacteriota bacterium]